MDPLKLRPKVGPEKKLQQSVIAKLRARGWFAKSTHGNAFQKGFPDVYLAHIRYGPRWLEMKTPRGKLEETQVETFTRLADKRIGIWILTGDADADVARLFQPPNWWQHLDCMKGTTRLRARKAKPTLRTTQYASTGPERDIQEALKVELAAEGWYCMETYGSLFQSGLPDLYVAHREYGARWVEVKNPAGYKFTPAQVETFPLMSAHGTGVWILDGPGQSGRLFRTPNWHTYLSVMK